MKDCVWQLILKGPDETMKNDSEQLSKTDQCCLFAFKHQMCVGPCRRKGKSQRRTTWTMSQTMFQARTNRPGMIHHQNIIMSTDFWPVKCGWGLMGQCPITLETTMLNQCGPSTPLKWNTMCHSQLIFMCQNQSFMHCDDDLECELGNVMVEEDAEWWNGMLCLAIDLERTWGHMFVFVTGKNGSKPCPKQCFKPGQRDLAWLLQKAIMSLFLDLWNTTLECLRTTSFKSLFWVSWFFDTIQQTKQLCMWASSSDSCFSNPTHLQQRSTGSMNQPAVAPGRFFINWLHSIQLLGFFCVHPLHRTCQKWTCTPWGNSHAPASGQMKVSCSVQCILPDFAHAIFCLGPTEIKEWMDGWLTPLLAWVGG